MAKFLQHCPDLILFWPKAEICQIGQYFPSTSPIISTFLMQLQYTVCSFFVYIYRKKIKIKNTHRFNNDSIVGGDIRINIGSKKISVKLKGGDLDCISKCEENVSAELSFASIFIYISSSLSFMAFSVSVRVSLPLFHRKKPTKRSQKVPQLCQHCHNLNSRAHALREGRRVPTHCTDTSVCRSNFLQLYVAELGGGVG